MSERLGGLFLVARDRLETAADDLGEIGGGEEDQRQLRAQQLVDGYAGGQKERQHHRSHEEN